MHGHYFKGSEECAVSWREGLCLGPCRRAEVSGESEGACWGRRGACAGPWGHRGKQPGRCWAPGSQRVARGFPGGSVGKNLPDEREPWVPSPGGEDPLEEEVATRSSVLAWESPWTEEPGGLQPMGFTKGHTRLSTYTHTK